MTNGEMKHGALDPHHRELQVDISAHDCVAHASFMGNFRFEAVCRKNTEFSE